MTGAIEFNILWPAFLAGCLVLATHVPFGRQVLNRGIVFIDLAVAQVAGLGVIAADWLGWEPQGWRVQVAAAAAAIAAALTLTWTEKRMSDVQEALIGVLFVCAASVEILLLANNPHGGEHLKDLLVGQIVWVDPANLVYVALLYAVILALRYHLAQKLGHVGFYLLFALSVTVSVQLVGIYLVFASLIVPALATRHIPGRNGLIAGYGIGFGGYALGLVISSLFDLPTGAAIVCALAVIALPLAARPHDRTRLNEP